MLQSTNAEVWRARYLRNVESLWKLWSFHGDVGCWLWTQDLYGRVDRHIGAIHGFAGVAFALLMGRELLPADQRAELLRRTREAIVATALRDGPHANWRLCAGASLHPAQPELRVQHCTGAPGIVNTMSALPSDPEIDALLMAAGELIWAAGPIAKLPSLCHGVPGSGYAFLKLHARTGDPRWLERARRFAMHAIEQSERGKEQHGQRKYSLWTGDLGLACYLSDCIRVCAAFPTLDFF
jgi:Lanthionine synthetase C-like protein